MSQSVSGVYCNEEVERGKRVENVVDIYESADAICSHEPKTQTKHSNMERNQKAHQTGGETTRSRFYKLIAVCLVLLSLLLLAAIIVLWIKFPEEKDQLQTRYNTLAKEKDQLQTSYDNLVVEKDQLQTKYTNVTMERDDLTMENNQLKKDMDTLEKNLLQMGWGFYNSSIYYISTEKKTWSKSREECKTRGADLVIINSREEQEFISKQFNQTEAWIGLNDIVKEGEFKWVDGKELSINFWWSGEPNDFGGNEDCAITGYKNATNSSSWADFPCDHIGRAVAMCKIILN